MPQCFLDVKNISKSFSGVHALKDVNLKINYGEIRCLAGENGCGKSTLIKIIVGAYTPDQGEIYINGKLIHKMNPIESIHKGIQVIYQDFSVFPNLTVAENIALNTQVASNTKIINWKWVYDVAKEAVNKINFKVDLKTKVENLTIAEKQLVAISRALVQDAKLIIMDEPTTALTQKEVSALFKVIKGLQNEGISILFVSHKLSEVFEICEKITILRNGENVIDGDISEFDRERFIFCMTGRKIADEHFKTQTNLNDCVLKVTKISRIGCFKDVSFNLLKGEILGITGLLGSGRTELAQALFGIKPAMQGEIHVNGKLVKIKRPKDAIDNKIAYVPEDRLSQGLFLEQSIFNNIIISIIDRFINKLKLIQKKKVNNEVESWIRKLNIKTSSSQNAVKVLSGGNQQRVVLAKWLSSNPNILILNAPTVGVDIGSKSDIHQIMRELSLQGISIILISDDIPEVIDNCERVLVMKKGKIIDEVKSVLTNETELFSKLSKD